MFTIPRHHHPATISTESINSDSSPATREMNTAVMLPCQMCKFPNSFRGEEALKLHLMADHFKHLPWVCTLCGGEARFATREQLVGHYEGGHGLSEYRVGLH